MPTIVNHIMDDSTRNAYSEEVKTFSRTLNFYSNRGYEYVRSKLDKKLPHVSTLRRWYFSVNGLPGFNEGSFEAIAKYPDAVWNLSMDNIHTPRKKICTDREKFFTCY